MRVGKALLHLGILACLALRVPVSGADLSESQLRDGLTKLSALMASEVPKNARWVLAESQGQRFGIFTREEDVFHSEGNTFLFDEKPGVEARMLLLSSGNVFTVKTESENGGDAESPQREYRATWKDANVANDVAVASAWLAKEVKKAGTSQESPSADPFGGNRDNPANQIAMHQQTALLWSAVLLHTGHEPEAMTLAKAALASADEKRRKQLLDGFFDRTASQAFQETMQKLGKHRDWNQLRDDLGALVKKYPLGWNQRDAVRVFHHHVTERAKLPAVPPLKTARPLPEAEQKVLVEWLKELESGKQLEYSRWTLPPLPDEDDGEVRERRISGQTAFPRSHGLAAVPLLAALLADDTLTLVGVGMNQGYNRHSYSGGNEDAATKLRNAYTSLQKPPTRAQLAWNLLERVLPDDLRSSGSENIAELAPEVLAWHASVKNATPGDLALAYLESGDDDEEIVAHALTVTDPKKLARLESGMIEQADLWDLNKLETFVEKLGPAKAPAFVAKVRQKLEGELSRFGANDQDNQRKQMETGLKRLEAAAKGEKKKPDMAALLVVLAAFDPAADDADQMVAREAFDEFPKLARKLASAERLEMILKALPDFKSPSLAANMLSFALRGEDDEKPDDAKPEERVALLERTKPHWQKLLDAPQGESEEEPLALLIQIVAGLEKLAQGKVEEDALGQFAALGDRGAKILKERATSLLAGQKPEPLPRAASIKSDERRQLLADWSQKTSADITHDLETLAVDKLLALNETLARGSDIPDNFKAHIALIHEVKIKDVADPAPWQAWRGKSWNKDTLVSLAKQVSAHTGGMLTMQIQRGAPIFGFKLLVTEVKKPGSNWQAQFLENAAQELGENLPKLGKRISVGFFQQGRADAQWTWLDAPVTEKPKEEPKVANSDDEAAEQIEELRQEEQEAWEVMSKAVGDSKSFPANLFFISVSTAELTKKD